MGIFGKLEDYFKNKVSVMKSDKPNILDDLTEADILEDLHNRPIVQGKFLDKTYIFGKFSETEIYELMAWSGIFEKLQKRGYQNYQLELQYLSDLDQRILIKWQDEVLIHMRLKLSSFRFRFSPGAPSKKLLFIDWLMTRDPLRKNERKRPLFQGQDCPGLGIFNEIADFVFNLAIGLNAKGAFNIPEYFHDAVLFHRQFRFYDPEREAFFRALVRDLRKYGTRNITEALSQSRVLDQDNQTVSWVPGEMITLIDPEFSDFVWNKDYFSKVVRYLKRYHFRVIDS
ncbi:MAG: hypothetical protein NZ853_01010 [Leptospiraceae bacterium]|nr:hypothetical protein [Leptospiraceae bacterium]MDW7976192.1 hypothetical protein [Leptospiraceae bacterium]